MNRSPDAGFSLVEAMVALFVFALAGVGLVQLQAHALQTLTRVEAHTLASLEAQNTLVEIMAGAPPVAGAAEVTFAGRKWRRTVTIAPTDTAQVVRISVRLDPLEARHAGAEVHGFLGSRFAGYTP